MNTRIMRKVLSFVLIVCMMVSVFSVTAFAAEQGTTFNYVSLGASNTNGYGMRGYITEEELALLLSGQVSKDDVNVYGYKRTPKGAYPDLIRDYYSKIYDTVNINQLAISSMRVEELRILLDDSYMGDDYSSWRFTGSDGWFKSAEPGGIPALRAAYQDSIKNADLITVDIGWNNFGVYVCNQLVDYMSNGQYKWTTDISSIFPSDAEDQAAAQAKAIIGSYIKNYVGEGAMANALTDIFAYSILGYIHNFDICMEKIYELNPDADVVVLGIQNLLYGVKVDLNGTTIPLGDIFGNFVNMANYYASACSPYQSRYQYVKAGNNEHVTIFLDYMKGYEGDAKNLDQNVKDCFDYYDDALYIQTKIDYVAADLIQQIVADVLHKEGLDQILSPDDALSVLKCENWLEVVQKGKAGKLPTDMLGVNMQEMFDDKYWPALYAAYDTLAVLVKEIAVLESVDGNGLLTGTVNIGAIENTLKEALEAEIMENAMAAATAEPAAVAETDEATENVEVAANSAPYTVDIDKILPDANTKVVAAMYIRYYMGNSFFAHPNGTGHAEVRDAVIRVINNPASEKDQALSDYLIESVKQIHALLCGATGHTKDFTHETAATCTQEGVSVTSCACGSEKEETALEKKPHAFVPGEPAWAEDYSSCTIILDCENCDATEEVIDDTIEAEVTKEASCGVAGEVIYTADFSECEWIKEPVTTTGATPEGGHDWSDWEESIAPGCEEPGEEIRSCECGVVETRPTNSIGHDYQEQVFAPTCEDEGYTLHTCSRCSANYTDSKVAALGHDYEDGSCKVCGEKDPDAQKPEKPSTPNWSNILKDWFGKWWDKECKHSYTSVVTAPTCTEKGYTTHTCSKCGDTYKDSYVDATGHDYEDGICTGCGEKDPDAEIPSTPIKPVMPNWTNIIKNWLRKWFR